MQLKTQQASDPTLIIADFFRRGSRGSTLFRSPKFTAKTCVQPRTLETSNATISCRLQSTPITVLNKSGETQHYVLLGGSNVLATSTGVSTPTGRVKYDVTDPNITYYVSQGDYPVGTVVDLSESPPFAMIDFTKARPGQTIAAVTHNHDGTFSPYEL
ncbi:hypothetical protein ACCO45_012742 [Purpureocillium lilacinum]|uniref:Uncharacterized protein n=1 Tax=Purpureocillium lilacinum TaxID=33203 RepID=A0ACC4DB27_PURLI